MELQTLVSTMHQNDKKLIERMNIRSNAIVINQCDNEKIEEYSLNNFHIKWINSKKRGLSISRNMALDNADCDICHLADDDLKYIGGYEEIILSQFRKYPDVDIIAFQVEGIERAFKNYYPYPRQITFLSSMKISSVEVAFRLEKVKQTKVRFNELFGSGSKYFMGEENIFLAECLRSGLKIMYVPIKIANLHLGESTWFKGFNKEYFINRGAVFTALSKKLSFFFILQFALRKSKLFTDEISIYQAIKFMLEGRRQLLKEKL